MRMTEAWWLALVYIGSALAGGTGLWYGWQESRRADQLEAEVDIAYLEGYDDGQHDLVTAQDRPLHEGYDFPEPVTITDAPDRGQITGIAAIAERASTPDHPVRPAPVLEPGVQADDLEPDPELADATAWLGALREHPPFPPGQETDTGWMRRLDLELPEAWDGSQARVDALAEAYYRKMGGRP